MDDKIAQSFYNSMSGLEPLTKKVMVLRYLEGKTQKEVSEKLNIHEKFVARIEQIAVEYIRDKKPK